MACAAGLHRLSACAGPGMSRRLTRCSAAGGVEARERSRRPCCAAWRPPGRGEPGKPPLFRSRRVRSSGARAAAIVGPTCRKSASRWSAVRPRRVGEPASTRGDRGEEQMRNAEPLGADRRSPGECGRVLRPFRVHRQVEPARSGEVERYPQHRGAVAASPEVGRASCPGTRRREAPATVLPKATSGAACESSSDQRALRG
jgi:hypothetical protein